MTVSLWQADGTQPVRDVDFLVVGAGLVGCSAAYFAAQMHGREVTITDMRDIALGASSRNAGFMITGLDTYYHHAVDKYGAAVTREMWKLSETTHSHLHAFADRGGNVRLERCGSMLLAESAEEARDLEDAARALDAAGIEHEYCSYDPLNRGYHAAIRQPGDASVQPYEMVQSIFQQSGAELVANNELYAIEHEDDHVLVYTRQYIFKARYVMLCTNAYSIYIDPYFVGKVIPTRAQCIATAPLTTGPLLNTCGYSDYGYMYYRDTFDGRLLIGGGRKQNKMLENDTTDDRITEPVQRILENYLRDKFPDVDVPIERRWAGIMGFSVDGLPLVGTLPRKPRVGFAVAFHGHGLAMGAGTAERAVEMLLKGTHPGAVSTDRLSM